MKRETDVSVIIPTYNSAKTIAVMASPSGQYAGDLNVVEIGASILDRVPFLRLLWFWTRFICLAIRHKPDVVYAHDFYMAFPGRVAAWLSRAKFVYDAHELIIVTRKNRANLRFRLFCLLERFGLSAAHLVVAANRKRARLMRKYYGLKDLPVPIRNIPSVTQSQALGDVENRYSFLRADGRRIIVYEGNVAISRGVHLFVNAMPLLRHDCVMVLIGSGTGLDRVRECLKDGGLEKDVFLLDSVPHAHLHSILGLCHVGIVTYSFAGLNNIYCSPNKLFEYAYAGLPVISSGQSVLRQNVEAFAIGEYLSPREMMQPDIVAEKIRNVLRNRDHHRANLADFVRQHRWDKEAKVLVSRVEDTLRFSNHLCPPSRG